MQGQSGQAGHGRGDGSLLIVRPVGRAPGGPRARFGCRVSARGGAAAHPASRASAPRPAP
eukprot:3562854-Prymnesium_polylepis.2